MNNTTATPVETQPLVEAPAEPVATVTAEPVVEETKEPLLKSPYNGVSYTRSNGKWAAKVLLNADAEGKRKLKHVGYFQDDREAALARNKYIDENGLTCRRSKIEETDGE